MRCLATALAAFLALGCQRDVKDLSPKERAKFTVELRNEANACYQSWIKSDLQDLAKLECFTDNYRRTTEIYPSPMSCASCYFNYGRGLHLLGVYWWERQREIERQLETAEPDDEADLRLAARAAREKVLQYFSESNDALESYVSTREVSLPVAYDWLSQHYAELGDYGRALRYLDLLDQEVSFSDRDQEAVDGRRRSYRRLFERQQLEEVRRALNG